ncbi:hypothetical protein M407DRAFT_19095 [Tulasnella calospora MUT 4182]|uniref:Uncharacterized protein n=1 Tax=Tulasnella calospora MUT 4182 TaxID=1051891 RepID=A0A0C3QSD1_9AGAM|nr:hypothetical protein M407DRAFT_19095 [Tulasnella calospora MUT 4182]
MTKSKIYMLTTPETWPEWSRLTQAALLSTEAWRHVKAKVVAPTAKDSLNPMAEEAREIRIHKENQDRALSIILEHLDPANACLVTKMTVNDAWTTLEKTHNQQTGNRQYSWG